MPFAKHRRNGRWTAVFVDINGHERSAGTFDTKKQAVAVAQAQEAFAKGGSDGTSPEHKATVTIRDYFPGWLRRHKVEPSTKKGYAATYEAYIDAALGKVRVAELEREQVRGLLALMEERGLSASTQQKVRTVLSAMMQTAWDDGYRPGASGNPIRGVKTQRRSRKPIPVLTTELFGRVHQALPTDGARLLGDLVVSTGCRLGEATPLTVEDWESDRRVIWFRKALQDVGAEFNPNGPTQRFYVAPYTKTHDHRPVSVDEFVGQLLDDWIETNSLGADDLLFPAELVLAYKPRPRKPRTELTPERLTDLGTFTAENGVVYQHGEVKAYVRGKCRCWACRQSAADYRNERNALKRSNEGGRGKRTKAPSIRYYDESPYVAPEQWRRTWNDACAAAKIGFRPTAYQLRHTHASWLINAGEDPKTVMGRLGHASLATTSLYVQAVEGDASSAALMGTLRKW